MFLKAGDRSNTEVIWQLCRTLVGLRMNISCHFCVQEGLRYRYPGGISVLILYHENMYSAKVKELPSMPQFYIFFGVVYQPYSGMLFVPASLDHYLEYYWLQWLRSQATASVSHFIVNTSLFASMWLPLITCHDNKLLIFQLGEALLLP